MRPNASVAAKVAFTVDGTVVSIVSVVAVAGGMHCESKRRMDSVLE